MQPLNIFQSIGGCGSLLGTTPNLFLKGYYDDNYKDAGLNFVTYMGYSLPASFVMLILTWITLCLIWLPRRSVSFKDVEMKFLKQIK